MTIQAILTPAQYATERAICDKAQAYADSVMRPAGKPARNWISADEAAHPDYAACNNDMRGRVEQFEILRDLPETIVAYIGELSREARDATNCASARRYPVTVWTGLQLGNATKGATWRAGHETISQFYARIGGREYTGRGQGAGMCIVLRETAASKRNRLAKIAA